MKRENTGVSFEIFKKKLSKDLFIQEYEKIRNHNDSYSTTKNDFERMKNTTEISALSLFLKTYPYITDIKWTGDQSAGNSFDTILYNNEKEQKVELTSLTDKKEMQGFRMFNQYTIGTRSIFDCLISESEAERIELQLSNEKNSEVFIYNRIVKILKKKNKECHRDQWLIISYTPISNFEYLGSDRV